MDVGNKASAWKFLEEKIGKIPDEVLRNAFFGEYARRAEEEWGFCPSGKKIPAKKEIELEDWQKDFLEEMDVGLKYGVVVKNEEIRKENFCAMMAFVRKGGSLSDIPERERNSYVDGLYYECLKKYGDDLMCLVDDFIEKNTALQES